MKLSKKKLLPNTLQILPLPYPNQIYAKTLNKYSTTTNKYTLQLINQSLVRSQSKKKNKLKQFLKDYKHNDDVQHLEQYIQSSKWLQRMKEMAQYYKYYTQTSILYQKEFFQTMRNHRQKEKIVLYNKLKILLNLSQSEDSQTASKHTLVSFQLLNSLTITQMEESQTVQKLSWKLNHFYGPSPHRSIQQTDKHFFFQKKDQESKIFQCGSGQLRKRNSIKRSQRHPRALSNKKSAQILPYRDRSKIAKRKHQSMSNLNELLPDKPQQNQWVTTTQHQTPTPELKTLNIKQNIKLLKSKIQKEKRLMYRKTLALPQKCPDKTSKRVSTVCSSKEITKLFGKIKNL